MLIIQNDLKNQIKEAKQANAWLKIIRLLNSEDNFDTSIADFELCNELLFAYGKLFTSLIDQEKEYQNGLKYYSLFTKYARYLIKREALTEDEKFKVYEKVAYNYYLLYINQRIWKSKFKANIRNINVKEAAREEIFSKRHMRTKALNTYYILLQKRPDHIKSNYRMGKLIEAIKNDAYYSSEINDLDISFLVGENYANTRSYFYVQAKSLFEKIKRYHYPELGYFNIAISLYENLNDKKQKDRNKKEYIRSLYQFCSIYIDCLYNFNLSLLGRDDGLLTDVSNREYRYEPKLPVLKEQEKVRKYLGIIAKLEGLPLNKDVAEQAKAIGQMDLAIQANFLYYRIAKYILAYKVQRGKENQVSEVVKYLYYAVLVDFYIAIDRTHSKTTSKSPYEMFAQVMTSIGMPEKLLEFADKYLKPNKQFYSRQLYDFCVGLGKAYRKMIDGDFSEAQRRLTNLERLVERDKSRSKIVSRIKKALDSYLNDGDNRKEMRTSKAQALIVKNTLSELGF